MCKELNDEEMNFKSLFIGKLNLRGGKLEKSVARGGKLEKSVAVTPLTLINPNKS